jgi:hypothetical protein
VKGENKGVKGMSQLTDIREIDMTRPGVLSVSNGAGGGGDYMEGEEPHSKI